MAFRRLAGLRVHAGLCDLHPFLGTTHQFPDVGLNPWGIVGGATPFEHQSDLGIEA